MDRNRIRQRLFWLCASCMLATCTTASGCRSDANRYVPPAEAAHKALEAVLGSWKDGRETSFLLLAEPPVTLQIADSWRTPRQRLASFQVLGEVSGEGARCFAVQLQLEDPKEDREVRYYVFGIDPLWVFSQKDYDGAMHWDACAETEPREGVAGPPL